MKHFMLPRGSKKQSRSKENLPPPDPNALPSDRSVSPANPKLRCPLPPRPPSSNPLKRKFALEGSENAVAAGATSDSGVKVVVRMRPPKQDEEDGEMTVQKVSCDSVLINGQTFTFDAVADTAATQLDIFELVGAPLVENCLAGFNSSIFAYGQTGSGKTYTMWGPAHALSEDILSNEQLGLTPRILERLFSRINEEEMKHAERQLKYQCRCSFLEIYNEQITDLLDPNQKNLQIREDIKSGVYVDNLTEESVSTMKDVRHLLLKGLSNRRTGATSINAESSRSHSVFTCIIESRCKSMADGLSSFKTSRINLVDLAGSERQKLTGAAGERLKEAGNINRSLSQLGNLINILAEVSQTGKQRHIPYRDSKLTFLLQESLGGNAKLAMVCAISPAQSTLRFAQRAKAIKNKAVVNEEVQEDVKYLREVIRQLRDELIWIKAKGNNPSDPSECHLTGQDIRRSLNILKLSLRHPVTLPPVDDDGDEEMEVDEEAIESLCAKASQHLSGAEDKIGNGSDSDNGCRGEQSMVDVNMDEAEQTHEPEFKKNLAASLHRGLEVIDGIRKSSALRQSAFRFSYRTADLKSILPSIKVDVGVQASCQDSQILKEAPETLLCTNCMNGMKKEVSEGNDGSNLQLVPINGSESTGKSKQVPKAVEKVLAGSFRREMALEDFCSKQASEIMQLNRLVKQYKHERECNAIIAQTREDKILRLESLFDGVLPSEEFVQDELASLSHECKILKEKYENHPELLRANIELKRHQDELEQYRNFFELGEKEVLLEEIQDLRCQLQYYIDSSSKSAWKHDEPLLLKYSFEPETTPALTTILESGESSEEKLIQEKLRWTEAESKWISLAEELRSELEASRSAAEKLKQELDTEKKCAEDLKEAMQLAMEGHARMLEQYADLEEKHMQLLARHRKIQDGIEDVKKAAAKAGVRGAESKFINSLAAEISALKVQRERERQHLRNENRELQAQLRDTAEAVQAAGELLARLKEAEEAVAAAQKRALVAEQETKKAYKEMEVLKRKHEKDITEARTQLLTEPHLTGGIRPPSHDEDTSSIAKYDTVDVETANDEQWRDEFKAFYDKGEDDLLRLEGPSTWFSGYDRCNI
ncbi:hypothetical protein CDL15_Pgr011634 [Punica granatum]|uniref:Kinesin motor domain-containing protein n=1 Tax=Punica granatum TaxID=22663 RepID=A0A218XHT9_PUNGR|nr:hypothetical protein CDL15_Pgr011634 [Punica granatum]